MHFSHQSCIADPGHILDRRPGEVYVHYSGTDKRLDEWVPESTVSARNGHGSSEGKSGANGATTKKRKRSKSTDGAVASTSAVPSPGGADGANDAKTLRMMSEEEYDIEHHKQITARRNFDRVTFGRWSIKTWYFSPYPLLENELDTDAGTPPLGGASVSGRGGPSATIGPRLPKVSVRSHGRTSDLFAGGLGRHYVQKDREGRESVLWVCDRCFKYMSEGAVWEGHCVSSPPIHVHLPS